MSLTTPMLCEHVCVCLLSQGASVCMCAHTQRHTHTLAPCICVEWNSDYIAQPEVSLQEMMLALHSLSLSPLCPRKCKWTGEGKKMLLWDREDASHCTINNPVKLCVAKAGSAATLSSFLTPYSPLSLPPTLCLPPSLPLLLLPSLHLHPLSLSWSQREMSESKREAAQSISSCCDAECVICSIHKYFLSPCRAAELCNPLRRKR